MREAGAKGTQAAFADLVKRAWLWGGALAAILIGAWYFEKDLQPYLKWTHLPTPIETTGSIKKAPALDKDALDRQVECKVKWRRDKDRLVDRRKSAWAVFEKCKTDWKPEGKETAEQACSSHLIPYRVLSAEVKEWERKGDDCTGITAAK